MTRKPAVSLAAMPGRRKATLEMAKRLEEEGFAGIYCPSLGDGLGLCEAIALATRTGSRDRDILRHAAAIEAASARPAKGHARPPELSCAGCDPATSSRGEMR